MVKIYQTRSDLCKVDQNWSNLFRLAQTCPILNWSSFGKTKQQQIIILYTYCMHISTRVWRKKTNNKNRTTKNKVPWNLWSYCRSEKEEENIIFSIHDFVATNRTNITVLNNIYWFLKKCFVSLFQLWRFIFILEWGRKFNTLISIL